MLHRLGVTGCCSQVALSEMLRGFAENFSRAQLQICPNIFRPGPDRPNVPGCRHGCKVVVVLASVPTGFGPGRKVVVKEQAAGQGICFSASVSSDFYVFPCATWGRARSWSWTAAILLDEVYAFLRADRWRARSRSWTAAVTTLLDEVYYRTTDPAADFGPGPEAVAEGRVAISGICFSASLTANLGPGLEAAAERCTAGRGICFLRLLPPTSGLARKGKGGALSWTGSLLSTPLAANFRPAPEEGAAEGRPTRRGVCFL